MLYLELLRHGETEQGGGLRGSLDDALTEQGWAQLRAAVHGAGPWDRLISSPLQRCARFAEEVAAAHGLPLHYEPGLQELHFGDWEGRSAAELMHSDAEALGQFWADPYAFTPPNGEPLLQFGESRHLRGELGRGIFLRERQMAGTASIHPAEAEVAVASLAFPIR